MEIHSLFQLFWLFLFYSFFGWLLEIAAIAIKKKKFANPGVLNTPFCIIYGFVACGITIGFYELKDSWFFLFLGSMIFSTVAEWVAGKLLEKTSHKRWWNYSDKKWNLDGYICLQASVIWGVLGVIAIKYMNPLVLKIYDIISGSILSILLWIVFGILAVDAVVSYIVAAGVQNKIPQAEEIHNRLGAVSARFGNWIVSKITRRMENAHQIVLREEKKKAAKKDTIFAEGINFYKLVMLFFIGAFLGDITEMLYCRLTAGVWMSRSSVVWGPFSLVWGLAIMIATALLYKYKDCSDSFLFLFGVVLGGAYEYLCSVFTEIAFGKVFWDYSNIPFNLGGRINLLYCLFWGIAAVVWFKKIYPHLSRLIEKLPVKTGKLLTWILIVFMTANICTSMLALIRYSERETGADAETEWQQWMDDHYDDAKMKQIYPNAASANNIHDKVK